MASSGGRGDIQSTGLVTAKSKVLDGSHCVVLFCESKGLLSVDEMMGSGGCGFERFKGGGEGMRGGVRRGSWVGLKMQRVQTKTGKCPGCGSVLDVEVSGRESLDGSSSGCAVFGVEDDEMMILRGRKEYHSRREGSRGVEAGAGAGGLRG